MIKVLNVESLYSALYRTIDFCKENVNEEIEIVVPDKLSLFMEKFLFEHMGISSSFNLKVSTLNRFAKKSCFIEKEKQISKIASIILIHKILNENINNLQVLKSKAYSFSYAEDIFKTITQLKASKICFEEMKNFSSQESQLNGKIKDLALIYENYENLKAGLLDSSDLFLMSSLSVGKGKENKKILFVGFDDFTAIEYSIIERLAMVANVYVMNYFSTSKNRYIYNDEVFYQLKNIAYINEIKFEVEDCFIDRKDLKSFLKRNLFSLEKRNYTLTKEIVKVFAGNKIQEEIEFCARDIRNKILNGQKFDDFGLAIFGLEGNERLIKEVFEKYEINYYIDNQMLLSKSVLLKFFINIFKYNLEPYNLSHIIDLINSPFLKIELNNKRLVVQKLVSSKFKGKINENFNIGIDEEIQIPLIEFFNEISFDKNIETKDLINQLKYLSLDIDLILNELSLNNVENRVLMLKSKEIIHSVFDDILKFYPGVNIAGFYDIFLHLSTIVKINNLPLKLDAVKVVDANDSMEIFKELYVVGATKEKAPNLKFDCGIILDNEIEKLNFSHKLSPTISHINKLARLRLFNTILLFENELTISYSISQSDIVRELLEKLDVETDCGKIEIVPISNLSFAKHVALSKWDYIEHVCKNKNYKKNIKINENIPKNKEFHALLNKSLKIFNDFNVVSATALENYFKCPFYAFLNNTLKIKQRLEAEILTLDIGNILHEILFKYYSKNKQVGDVYEFCKRHVFKCVEKEERLKLNIDSPIIVNLIDEAVRVISALNYIDENSSFKPKYFEFGFNENQALKLRNINVVGKVDRVDVFNDMFRIVDYKSGKADASLKELYYGNKLQLFLYSCAMEIILNKKGVGSFYLPLHNAYTKELENTYSMKGFYLAEDFVVRSFDKRLQAGAKSDIINVSINKNETIRKTIGYKELESNELLRLKNYSKTISENAVDEIKSGYIKPSPSEVSKPCEFCPYVNVCLRNCNEVNYRKSNKINLESFKEADND